MAVTDDLLVDGDVATFVSQGLPANTAFDVWFRWTDTVTEVFHQGSRHDGASDGDGVLTVTFDLNWVRGGHPKENAAKLHVWVHPPPVLEVDPDTGLPVDNGYDRVFWHVLDKGGGNLAEATATIDV